MYVEELEARIDKLANEIKELQHQKCATQRQLNALRDPVERLPLEISSEIFLQCPFEHDGLGQMGQSKPQMAPLLLLQICRAWTNIASYTPALWARVHMDRPRANILQVWLQRARNHALAVSLRRTLSLDLALVLRRHSEQLTNLYLRLAECNMTHLISDDASWPGLRTFRIGLQFDDEYDKYHRGRLPLAPLRALLCRSESHRIGFGGSLDMGRQ
ncbi:hypothetical protein B0H16DRAFT_1522769 [Mycena metata]|uniref:F-box domain-containing protein n=1 Tax=Mycena metata TaxID=1033252 RepID=A0AAD7JKQ6_9AGAR|nr:hypothetical protein B0H16DRAFT_1522769 [Mycena metata]